MTIQALQQALASKHLYVGPIDGDVGPGTTAGLISYASMKAISPSITAWSAPLASVMKVRDISTPLRLAHFIATLAYESQGFTRFEENLNYTTPARLMEVFPSEVTSTAQAQTLISGGPAAIADCVYAGRNGNTAPTDGWTYRGRGPTQLTGKANYAAMAKVVGVDLVNSPSQATQPDVGSLICGAFWSAHGLNVIADADDAAAIRRAWNGPAMQGLSDVKAIAQRIVAIS